MSEASFVLFRNKWGVRSIKDYYLACRLAFYYQFNSIPWGIMSGFLSILSALASLSRTPFWSDGDKVELIVIVLLIWLARVLSRRLELFKRTTNIIADNISKRAPKIPNTVPRNGLIWSKVGWRAGEKSENGKTTAKESGPETTRRRKMKGNENDKINIVRKKFWTNSQSLLFLVLFNHVEQQFC